MAVKLLTIKELKKFIKEELASLYPSDEAESIATIAIEHATGLDRLRQLTMSESVVEPAKKTTLESILTELKTGKPVQYVTGETWFHGCWIKVNSSTLVPRPETEELARMVIEENAGRSIALADLGTGSGCIAVSLAKYMPLAKIYGTDISENALETAKENARLNDVQVTFIKADILGKEVNSIPPLDVIVSNPPYVRDSEKALMSKNVLEFEPHLALFVPDEDPLVFYRAIAESARTLLRKGGKLYMEVNESLGNETAALVSMNGFVRTQILRDINGKDRFIKACLDE
ncbi:MAG: peptide chain release factor N(5)-glutamine methyltransferase [Bacteroidales bacterium]